MNGNRRISSRRLRSLFAPALIAIVALAGCADGGSERLTGAPEIVYSNNPWEATIREIIKTASQPDTKLTATIIGTRGGQLANGEHLLTVPNRALSEPALFLFTAVGGSNLQVDLRAIRLRDGAEITSFNKRVTLRLSYRGALVSDPAKLLVAWLIDGTINGRVEPLFTTINPGRQYVTAELEHFSSYVLATN